MYYLINNLVFVISESIFGLKFCCILYCVNKIIEVFCIDDGRFIIIVKVLMY